MGKTDYSAYIRDLIAYLDWVGEKMNGKGTIQGFQNYLKTERNISRSFSFCRDICLMAQVNGRITREGSHIDLKENEKKLLKTQQFFKDRIQHQKKTGSRAPWKKTQLTTKEQELLNPS